jgi:hypothetical protein
MDAAGRIVANKNDGKSARSPLRLRREPGGDTVDAVVDTFLGGDCPEPVGEAVASAKACGDAGCDVCTPTTEFKPLRLRCPKAAAVLIGVEPNGRLCLEVQVGAGAGVSSVLGELEEVEKWLRSSAHDAATWPVVGRVDMSYPIRRRVVVEGDSAVTTALSRAGLEVRGSDGRGF